MRRGAEAFLLVFAAASFAAVAVGAAVSARSGVADALWIRNLAAWAIGGLVAWGLSFAPPVALRIALWSAPVALAASFLSPALDGVHRWIDIGPLHLNAAMVFLPPAVIALAADERQGLWAWLAPVLCLALLSTQPDASQATTLAAVLVLVAGARAPRLVWRMALVLSTGLAAGFAWLRPDPLQPVPGVELIIGLAFALTPLAGVAAVAALAATAAVPVLASWRTHAARLPGLALGLCLLMWSVMPFLGAFPVPLVGIGMSPIVGAWLGAGALASLIRRSAP